MANWQKYMRTLALLKVSKAPKQTSYHTIYWAVMAGLGLSTFVLPSYLPQAMSSTNSLAKDK